MLSVFVPTFFLVSLTPGMCMTLSMLVGMTQRVRRRRLRLLGETRNLRLLNRFAGSLMIGVGGWLALG